MGGRETTKRANGRHQPVTPASELETTPARHPGLRAGVQSLAFDLLPWIPGSRIKSGMTAIATQTRCLSSRAKTRDPGFAPALCHRPRCALDPGSSPGGRKKSAMTKKVRDDKKLLRDDGNKQLRNATAVQPANALTAACAMLSASTAKKRRSAARVSLRPKPSVPKVV